MSWSIVQKSQMGPVTYTLTSYSDSLGAGISNQLKVLGYTQGSITFTTTGNTTATLYGSNDGINYFSITSKENPTPACDKLSWEIPVQFIKIHNSDND